MELVPIVRAAAWCLLAAAALDTAQAALILSHAYGRRPGRRQG